MSDIRSLGALRDAASAVLSWSAASGVPIVVIGGVAVSILSKPRTTKDVDVIVWLPDHETWSTFLASSKRFGIVTRIPNALEFALQSRVLLLRHEPSGVPIDVSMGALPFEELAIKRAVQTIVGDFQIPVPTPEDPARHESDCASTARLGRYRKRFERTCIHRREVDTRDGARVCRFARRAGDHR